MLSLAVHYLPLQLDTAHDPGRLAEGLGNPHYPLFPWCKLCGLLPSMHWFLEPSICWLASLKDPEKHSYTTLIVVLWICACWLVSSIIQCILLQICYNSSVDGIILSNKWSIINEHVMIIFVSIATVQPTKNTFFRIFSAHIIHVGYHNYVI